MRSIPHQCGFPDGSRQDGLFFTGSGSAFRSRDAGGGSCQVVKEAGAVYPVGGHDGKQYGVGIMSFRVRFPPPSSRIGLNNRLVLSTLLLPGSTPSLYRWAVMPLPSLACLFLRRAMILSLLAAYTGACCKDGWFGHAQAYRHLEAHYPIKIPLAPHVGCNGYPTVSCMVPDHHPALREEPTKCGPGVGFGRCMVHFLVLKRRDPTVVASLGGLCGLAPLQRNVLGDAGRRSIDASAGYGFGCWGGVPPGHISKRIR